MADTFPEGFIPLGDAFALALSAIEDCAALLQHEATTDAELHDLINKHETIERRVESLMRDALADGDLHAFIRTKSGQIEELVDREDWRQKSFGVPGIENKPHHLANPGPDTGNAPVLLKTSNLEDWLTKHRHAINPFRTGGPGKPSAIGVIEREHQRRLSVGNAFAKVSQEAAFLKKWLDTNYPDAPNTTIKTIENRIRDGHRKRTV